MTPLNVGLYLDAKISLSEWSESWDLFISAYNNSERVKTTFASVNADRRHWWVLPEYAYTTEEVEHLGDYSLLPEGSEAEVIKEGLEAVGYSPSAYRKICIDITGMMRPQILFLIAYLKELGVAAFDLVYTEPEKYSRRAETRFSVGEDVDVRSVIGYIGAHDDDTSGDVLVLGIGYDHHLISHALQAKEVARILQLHSFPSLSADMYHESILRLDRVRSERPRVGDEIYYSSANDPFIVAAALSDALISANRHKRITNIYLSPLATKPQAVGFGLFYHRYLSGQPATIIYPNCPRYDRETSTGVGRSWVYPIIM